MQAARRQWHVALYVLALVTLVALVAAVSSWAADDSAPAEQTTTPIHYQAPENGRDQAPEGEGADRPPCPEGERGDSQQQQQGKESTV